MAAFPLVLKKVPNAKLVVAGANHHARAGYWESRRDAQPSHRTVEFRGYVAEEEIPELFATSSLLVLPYDSATGSSGPAHQACEYGVPIVCADIPDFREMVTDEGLAAHFYRIRDAEDLAKQLIGILQSPELQQTMAVQNHLAGIEMTMPKVIGNYLRCFRLNHVRTTLSWGNSADSGHIASRTDVDPGGNYGVIESVSAQLKSQSNPIWTNGDIGQSALGK